MNDTTAYRIGQIAGAIIALAMLIGICVFFIVALIKALRTRRKGWIIAASISSVPFLLFLLLFMMALIAGLRKGFNRSAEISAAHRAEPSQLLTAAMTRVSGNSIPYEISIPWLSAWKKDDSHAPFDYLFSYRDAYVGIIAEGIGLGSPERIGDISQKNLARKASEFSATEPVPIEIDSHSWLTYDATATVEGIGIKYRFYVYADSNYTFQIVTWTGPALFKGNAPVFDRIAKSLKMPK
jgi:uncharacterized membrane protein